jgi:hypothetical protein
MIKKKRISFRNSEISFKRNIYFSVGKEMRKWMREKDKRMTRLENERRERLWKD